MNVHRNLARLLGLAGLILAGVLLLAAPAVATVTPAAGPGDFAVPVEPPPPDPDPAVEPGADDIGVEQPCWQTDTCEPPVDPCEKDPESCEPVDPCVADPKSCEPTTTTTTPTTTPEPLGVPVPTRIDTGEGPVDPAAWWLVALPGLALVALAARGAYSWIVRSERSGR